jgi:hypothetical protein
MYAARFNHGSVIQHLIRCGANVHPIQRGGFHWTALAIAAAARASDAVEKLVIYCVPLVRAADYSAVRLAARCAPPQPCGCTTGVCGLCLQRWQVRFEEVDASLQSLQQAGIDLNALGSHGEIALKIAVCINDDAMAKALIARGASLQFASQKAELLNAAVLQSRGHHKMLRLLLRSMKRAPWPKKDLRAALSTAVMRLQRLRGALVCCRGRQSNCKQSQAQHDSCHAGSCAPQRQPASAAGSAGTWR